VADDDDLVATALDYSPHVVDARSGSEPFVGLGVHPERPRELVAGLARAKQWAREDDRRRSLVFAQPLAERSRLRTAFPGQRAQLVGLSRSGFGMSDEVEAHRIARITAWLVSAT
jgi:hypothetical protein